MPTPASDETEVTILGPGFGESIVIHLGMGEWIIVDSCIDSKSGRPAAITYLESLGVNLGTGVKLVLTSHWHDDHVAGLAEVLTACPGARFCCSVALTEREFQELAHVFNNDPLVKGNSGLTEIQRVFQLLRLRRQVPVFAGAEKPIFTGRDSNGNVFSSVRALSPSDAEYNRFLAAIAAMTPAPRTTKFRLPSPASNDLSVAAWVTTAAAEILLGADLEEHQTADRGWSAVLASPHRPQDLVATAFKVAHHGSYTGHHDGVWSDLLVEKPWAVLTPWNRGRKLPTAADCDRITSLTERAYITSNRPPRSKRYEPAVEKTLREAEIRIRDAEPATGFVRLRKSPRQADWSCDPSPEAIDLRNYTHY